MVCALAFGLLVPGFLHAALVADVRAQINKGDYIAAERLIAEHRREKGTTPESLVAHSWLGRGKLAANLYDQAETYAAETRAQCLELLKFRKLDDEPDLPVAFGASIETHGLTLAGRGQRSEAVSFLKEELQRWYTSSIRTRIQKNINLLSLTGTRPPALTWNDHLGQKPPTFEQLQGKAVLLFFWAHWCPDCKHQGPIVAQLRDRYASQGLAVVAPTQYYGYAEKGDDAPPEKERAHIEKVRQNHYPGLLQTPTPISQEDFKIYGVSTTPTLVLLDRQGKVAMYHPGKMTIEELTAEIEKALR